MSEAFEPVGTPVQDAEALWARLRAVRDEPAAVVVPPPPPQVQRRPAAEHEIPKAAQSLADLAAKVGWTVEVTYARGTPIDAGGEAAQATRDEPVMDPDSGEQALTPTGRPKVRKVPTGVRVVDSVAVRLRSPLGARRAVVVWEDGATRCAYRVRPHVARTTLTDLRKELRDEPGD